MKKHNIYQNQSQELLKLFEQVHFQIIQETTGNNGVRSSRDVAQIDF